MTDKERVELMIWHLKQFHALASGCKLPGIVLRGATFTRQGQVFLRFDAKEPPRLEAQA